MSHPAISTIPVALAASGTVPDPRSSEPRSCEAEPSEPGFAGPAPADPTLPDPPLAECVQYFAATESAPGWARRHTTDVLRRWDAPDVRWAACQVVSELVTNAVRHAGKRADGAPAPCGLTLRLWPDALAVEVWDPFGGILPEPRAPGLLDLSGRGLGIVAALASAPLAVHPHPTEGKTVVAVLARTPEEE